MLKFRKRKAFTLVEILITIAIIGILAAIILVMISTSKDKTKQRAVYAKLRSAQAQANQCLINNQSRINCNAGSPGMTCRGWVDGTNSTPNENQNICYSGGDEKWPTISADGFQYLGGSCSRLDIGAFSFSAAKNSSPDVVLCCSQLGCKEITILTTTDNAIEECKTMAGLGGATGPGGCNRL